MAIGTNPLHPLFGVEILGIDVRRVDEATFADVVQAFDEHSVLLFRRQPISDEEQIAFSRRFGPLETTIRTIISEARTPREISSLANVDAEDRLIPHGDTRNLFNAGTQMRRRWPRCSRRAKSLPRAARLSSPACESRTSGCPRP